MKLLILLALFSSCQPDKKLSIEECEELSFKSYKGFPKAANDLKKHCSDYRLKYTKEICQKAFKELIINGNEEYLKQKFGEKIINCFSEKEKKKFLRSN